MSRFSSLTTALALALCLGACDSDGTDGAQPQENSAADKQGEDAAMLNGTLTRDFAGDPIPDVTVTAPDGTTLALRETAGQPVLLNLWATWCAPCVHEMPLLDELAGELDGQVRVLTVSEDMKGAEAVEPFFAERNLPNLPMWMDERNDLAFAFGGGASLPLTVLYDAQGREVWRVMGGYDWASEDARALVLEDAGA
ncbi:TlpA family protein disulfide reductase [Paraurantiacibacter namhicola]|uniref:Thiol:disulfide interchange protein TlpA n=1 Tax=Paraurantiacibacter namhicola TaxID=645517 RepID=A0A1C7D7H5_9SPHN|nr:TlpA disulfide reductase family protein [Paraurantiacibacter namhicola]ANU07395.1 Thiol:disulfide interchange protein TlpA [Paraurantiacibacter namhicola]